MNVCYGPYIGKDGRYRVFIVDKEGNKKTISYPRMIMETFLKRSLMLNEDVHHIDGDVSNNDISNLEVKLHTEHCREHSTKYIDQLIVKCVWCGNEFILTPMQQRRRFSNRNIKKGPFCSRRCSGKYGADIQRAAK